jgi:septum formation protein
MSGDGFVLASASPRRLQLLAQIGLTPNHVHPADINEDPVAGELPRPHASRLAQEKAAAVHAHYPGQIILAADTVVAVGRRILPKTLVRAEAEQCLRLMRGRAHRVFTGVCVIDADGVARFKVSETRLKMTRLSDQQLTAYLDSEEWHGKAGGYGIQGQAAAFIPFLSGSYTGVVGLPIYETGAMLRTAGLKV